MIHSWRREGGFGGADLECSGPAAKRGHGSGGAAKHTPRPKMVEALASIVDDVFAQFSG